MNTALQKYIRHMATNPVAVLFGSFALLIFAQLMGALAGEVTVSGASETAQLFVIMGVSVITLGVCISVLLQLTGYNWHSIGIRKPRRGWLKLLLISAVAYLLLSSALIALATMFVSGFDVNQAQDIGISGAQPIGMMILGFLTLVVLTPIFEEILFRGLLSKGLRARLPFSAALLVSSGLFAAAHGQWNIALDTFALGLILGYLTEKSGSIIPAVILHAVKNSVAFVILFVL